MNTRQKLTLGIAAIFMITLTIVGVTYAYFVTKVNGNTTDEVINVSTANLGVEYGDGNGLVTLSDVLPGTKAYKVFTVTNDKSSVAIPFKIVVTQKKGTDTAFVHTDNSKLTTNCYVETPISAETNCYVEGQVYNSLKVAVKKYSGNEDLTTKQQSELKTVFVGQDVTETTASTPLKAGDEIQELASVSIEGKTSSTVKDTYILELSYEEYNGNQNIENNAEVTVKVNIVS